MDPGKKPSRWRRTAVECSPAAERSPPPAPAEVKEETSARWKRFSMDPVKSIGNEAAAHAFRGLHGKKSDFSIVESAADRALSAVLDGNAHYYKALASEVDDFSTYEALVSELEYKPIWMTGGLTLHRPAAVGSECQLKKSPTYERIVRFLAGFFGVEPIRSLVNHYRSAEDFTAFHSDQYYGGVNMTIGASFGEERALVFEHRETREKFRFPQQNGDVFAFTDAVNRTFVHGVPRETRAKSVGACRHTPGRISVIVWGRRDQELWKQKAQELPINLHPLNVLEYDPSQEQKHDGSTSSLTSVPTTRAHAPAHQMDRRSTARHSAYGY